MEHYRYPILNNMNTEIEAKFLHIHHDTIRKQLKEAGAICVTPMRLMRRAIIDYPDRRLQEGTINSFVRVRDEGDKITLTYKQFNTLSLTGAQEVEAIVDSFDDTIKIFTAIGLVVCSLQESKRETWELGSCEIVLDEWPWLDPYIEIEGTSAEVVQETAQKIGLVWDTASFGDVMVAYRDQYSHLTGNDTIGTVPEVRFNAPLPELLKNRNLS